MPVFHTGILTLEDLVIRKNEWQNPSLRCLGQSCSHQEMSNPRVDCNSFRLGIQRRRQRKPCIRKIVSIRSIFCLILILASAVVLLLCFPPSLIVVPEWMEHQYHMFLTTRIKDPLSTQVKIAIYMTTHQDDKHLSFLSRCWVKASHTLRLLSNADLIYYAGGATEDIPYPLLSTMGFRSIIVYPHVNSSYQQGAKRAMVDPYFHPHWFQSYDWIIKLNPDVLIRNDTWLIEQMLNTTAQAIAIRVQSHGVNLNGFHSDFVAFRPQLYQMPHVTAEKLLDQLNDARCHAEPQMLYLLTPLMDNGTISYLPDVVIINSAARVLGLNSSVIHDHSLLQYCPDYFNATNGRYY
jgi:hypothetical protein